jgi:hypothetical protein
MNMMRGADILQSIVSGSRDLAAGENLHAEDTKDYAGAEDICDA